MDLVIFGILLPWIVVATGCWISYQLIRQNGRILLRLERLEKQLAELTQITRSSESADQVRVAPSAAFDAALAPPSPPPVAAPAVQTGLPIGSAAPNFELPDLTGRRTPLSAWRGHKVLLTFFNPQCGFCSQMAPDLA